MLAGERTRVRGRCGPRPAPRAPPFAARPPLPGAVVLVPRAAAVGEEADATQDGEQGGAPAQVEGGAQLVPGDKDDEQVVLARGRGGGGRGPPITPVGGAPTLTWFQGTRGRRSPG